MLTPFTRQPKTSFLALFISILCFFTPLLSAQTTIRVMAANTTSGNQQSYLDPGNRIFQGLKPDIVLIQEFSIGPSGSTATATTEAWVDDIFGTEFFWVREPGGDNIPNGVISRWPIIASGQITDTYAPDRDHSWARIDIPGDRDLWVVSVHLLTRNSSTRSSEATELVSGLNGLNIPSTDYLVIGGDFNTGNFNEPCLSTFRSYLGITSSTDLRPEDRNSNTGTNAGRNKPYDQVLARQNFNTLQVPTVVGAASFPKGLVFDSRVFTPLSAVAPVQSGDSAATNMQHMAVIKDFQIPEGQTGEGNSFSVIGSSVNFGVRNVNQSPFDDNTITLNVNTPFTLTTVNFSGVNAQEFQLISPPVPSTITTNTPLVFRWSPTQNNGVLRSVTANFNTNAVPANFSVTLTGTAQDNAQTSDPIDLSGYVLRQFNSSATYTIPNGTLLNPQQTLVVGRNANRSAFESFWGIAAGSSMVYLNATATGNEFPLINGAETYTLSNAQNQQIDPPNSGEVPEDGLASGQRARRVIVNSTVFQNSSAETATPGNPEVNSVQLGDLVITEVSDAVGAGNFIYEFVELYYDAPTVIVQPEKSMWFIY